MERVLVTGAAGFIGSNLTLELVRRGYDVVALDNFISGVRPNLKEFKGKFIDWDVTKPLYLDEPFRFIFHDGDITDPRYPRDDEVYSRNLKCFENMLALARSTGARLIYASTANLYGNGPTPMCEDQDEDIISSYGRSKAEIDRIAATYFDRMSLVGLRYFNVFGPRETHKARAASMVFHLSRQMVQKRRPRLFKYGEQKRDFIYVKDIVEANLCAMKAPSGVYNVGTGAGTTFNELVATLNDVLGTKLEIEYFDMPYVSQTYQHNTQADTERAEKLLGFKARWTLRDAIVEYMKWLRDAGQG